MANEKNVSKYGLARKVPEPVQREIRQNCGHGCVFCGCMLIEYEHVDPLFVDCRIHDPSKMCLLCPTCHRKVTAGLVSKDQVKEAMNNPKAKQKGFANEFFSLQGRDPVVNLGNSKTTGAVTPLSVNNYDFVTVKRSTERPDILLLSAAFYDSTGNDTLVIKDNEWMTNSLIWDVELSGRTLTIRERRGVINLIITLEPPHTLKVERLNMLINGCRYSVKSDGVLTVTNPDGSNMLSYGNNAIRVATPRDPNVTVIDFLKLLEQSQTPSGSVARNVKADLESLTEKSNPAVIRYLNERLSGAEKSLFFDEILKSYYK